MAHGQTQGDGGLLRTLVTGAKDIPKNASWLAGKALPHESSTNGSNGTSQHEGG